MLKEEAFEILKSEWIVGLENGDMGNTFSDTYKLKDGAPYLLHNKNGECCTVKMANVASPFWRMLHAVFHTS